MLWFTLGGIIILSMIWVDRMLHPRQKSPQHPVLDYGVCFVFGVVVLGSPMWLLFGS